MKDIDEYYNRIIDRINNTNNKYLKSFKLGFVQGIDMPLIVEELDNLVHKKVIGDNPITIGNKAKKCYIDLNTSYNHILLTAGLTSGIICGAASYGTIWGIMGILDTANYIQRKD